MSQLINTFPTKDSTNPDVLYSSLGSFWTNLFQEKGTIKGYTIGQAEELIQSYLNLLETINSYSIDKVSVFHREKWYPMLIKKSDFNRVTLTFQQKEAVYGTQPVNDPYYGGQIFKLGYPKNSDMGLFSYRPPAGFVSSAIICDKVLNPSKIYVNGADYYIKNEFIYFNSNVFDRTDIVKFDIVDDAGNAVYFKDSNNIQIKDQMLVMWAYNASVDTQTLYSNFGYLFNLQLHNDDFYKSILLALVKFYNNGATVETLKIFTAAILGVTPVKQAVETVEDIFNETNADGSVKYRHVVTDKTAYRFDPYYKINSGLKPGDNVYAGDILVDAFEYYDNVQSPYWWKTKLAPKVAYNNVNLSTTYPGMYFPSFVFLGNYEGHLHFSNDIELLTYDYSGKLTFPIGGSVADIKTFNDQLNTRVINGKPVKDSIVEKLGMSPGDTYPITPLDFLFDNFIKGSTAALKLNFKSADDTSLFMAVFPTLKELLPKHVYLLVYIDFPIPQDEYDNLNNSLVLMSRNVNADGSDDFSTGTTGIVYESAGPGKHNNPINTRLFTFGHGINLGTASKVKVGVPNSAPLDTINCMEGLIKTDIPNNATTAEIRHIELTSFCPVTTTTTSTTSTTTTPTTTTTTTPTTTSTTTTSTTTTSTTSTTTTSTTTPTTTTTTTTTTLSGSTLNSGLVYFLNLDEASGNRIDATGNGFDFSEFNGTISSAAGMFGNSALFVRSAVRELRRPSSLALQFSGDFTVSMWVRPSVLQLTLLQAKGSGVGSGAQEFFLRMTATQFDANMGNGITSIVQTISTVAPVANQWFLVVAWRSGNTLYISVNNETPVSADVTGYNYTSSGNLSLGAFQGGLQGLDGRIDAHGRWNRALTTGERNDLWSGGAGTYYPF